ncbi:hypothetical protein ACFL4D_02920 [Candidatus Margulisiibacteriota bacterium]
MNLRIKLALQCLLINSFIWFYIIYCIKGLTEFNLHTIFTVLPSVVTIDLVLYTLFSQLLWKLWIFRGWLVPFPNLNGTWKGHIQTTWEDPETGKRPNPIPAILTIKQSFSKISCIMRTAEMASRSIVSDFVIDKENQLKRLFYTYDSNPIQTVKERSPQHCGTMCFDIVEKPTMKLVGEYWTGRKTTGQIEMTYWKKERLDYYPEELGEHPVSKTRKYNN